MTTATAATLAAAIHDLRQTATKPDATLAELHKAAQGLLDAVEAAKMQDSRKDEAA